jgi:hypothetical protein
MWLILEVGRNMKNRCVESCNGLFTVTKNLGLKLRNFRKTQKLSQLDLGFLTGNHGEQIGRIKRGELNVRVCTLKKI